MRIGIFNMILCFLFISFSCKTVTESMESNQYSRWVGDIAFDQKVDDPDFTLCQDENFIYQYFNDSKGLQFKGEKRAILNYFEKFYKPINQNTELGYVRIRFVVNCKGETGRFRLSSCDMDLKEKEFESEITDQLLSLTKSLKGWEPKSFHDNPGDYYQFLIFKMKNGMIDEIMP